MLSLEDLHFIATQACHRLWREMDASIGDGFKIVRLVRSQFIVAMESTEKGGLAAFKTSMLDTPFAVIQKRIVKEMEAGDDFLSRRPIRYDRHLPLLNSVK